MAVVVPRAPGARRVRPSQPRLRASQVELADANAFVARLHRHHKPVIGHRFSIGVQTEDGVLRGIAIVGRPVARMVPAREVVEVARLATDGTPNACSFLYQAAARIAKELGYLRVQTYVLDSEPGTSLRAAGWRLDGITGGDIGSTRPARAAATSLSARSSGGYAIWGTCRGRERSRVASPS